MDDWEVVDHPNPPAGMVWVAAIAEIRDNKTGQVRRYENNYELLGIGADKPDAFIWKNGNYACDCNRSLFFLRAGGESEELESDCGEGEFSVRLRNKKTGAVYYDEFTHLPPQPQPPAEHEHSVPSDEKAP